MQSGELLIPCWPQSSTLRYDKLASFETRMSAVVNSLERSKALCKNLLYGHLTWEKLIAMQPAAETKTKGNNSIVNAARNNQVSYANKNMPKAGKRGITTSGIDKEEQYSETKSPVAAMRPKKKARGAAGEKPIIIKPWGLGSVANGSAKTTSSNTITSSQDSQSLVSTAEEILPVVSAPAANFSSPVSQVNNHSRQVAGPSFDQQTQAFQHNFQQQHLPLISPRTTRASFNGINREHR